MEGLRLETREMDFCETVLEDFLDGREEAADATDTSVGAGDTLGGGAGASSRTGSGLLSAGCCGGSFLLEVSFVVLYSATAMGEVCFVLRNFLLMTQKSRRIKAKSAAAAMTPPMM